MRTLLITGAAGFLGSRTARRAMAAGWRVVGGYRSAPGTVPGVDWRRLDLTDATEVAALVAELRPDAVVNTAYRQSDWASTADGAITLARAVGSARLVQVSSDVVFGGRVEAYTESDRPSPITPYGAAKAAAEVGIAALRPRAVIVRTSLILGDGDSTHEQLIRDIGQGRRDDVLFTDELRCPIHVADLAAALVELLDLDVAGPLHVAGPDAVSRFDLGRLLAPRLGVDPGSLSGGPATPPHPSLVQLDTAKARTLLTTRLRGVTELASVPVGA